MDREIGFWIRKLPYLYTLSPESNISTALTTDHRYYLAGPDDIVYDVSGKTFKAKNMKNTQYFLIDPTGECAKLSNFFEVYTSPKISEDSIWIEGQKYYIEPDNVSKVFSNLGDIVEPLGGILEKSRILDTNPYSSMPFFVLGDLLEKYEEVRSVKDKQKLLEKLFRTYKGDCYVLLKMLLPQFDRRTYFLKESKIANLYVNALSIPPNSQIAKEFTEWKPLDKKGSTFISLALKVIKLYVKGENKSNLTLEDIDARLENISMKENVDENIRYLIKNLSIPEQTMFLHILLKKGLSDKIVLNALHSDAWFVFNLTSDLKKVCDYRDRATVNLNEITSIGTAIRPMLASRRNPDKIKIPDEGLILETKYDGERLQIHKKDRKITLFSRKGINVTNIYSSLVPDILACVKEDCIIDGEVMIWDRSKTKIEGFGKLKLGEDNDRKFYYVAFDLLYVKNKHIMDLPLKERLELLKKIIVCKSDKTHRFEIEKSRIVKTIDEIVRAVVDSQERGEEGIMLKLPLSQYTPALRTPAWIKVKPNYLATTGDNLDVLIIGAYRAGTEKRGEYSSFLCGVRGVDNTILSFCKVGTGFDMEVLKQIQEELSEFWLDPNKDPPGRLDRVDFGKEIPDVWIKSENSRVITVKGFELNVSSKGYAAGYTLRFPVFEKIRYDKDLNDVVTIQEIIEMDSEFQSSGASRFPSQIPEEGIVKKVKMEIGRRKKEYVIPKHFLPATIDEKIDDKLKGIVFCVLAGNDEYDKQSIERIILSHGGEISQAPTPKVKYVISLRDNVRTKNYIQAGGKVKNMQFLKDLIK